jgi:hypothetical protein
VDQLAPRRRSPLTTVALLLPVLAHARVLLLQAMPLLEHREWVGACLAEPR